MTESGRLVVRRDRSNGHFLLLHTTKSCNRRDRRAWACVRVRFLSVAPPPPAPVQEEFNAAVRRLSVAPLNRTLNAQSRHLSWRHGSIPWFRFPAHEGIAPLHPPTPPPITTAATAATAVTTTY